MNMNDNYLWDRTGEPDTEVRQLEDLLGTLRYQPRPLEIPATVSFRRRRTFVPLAIAAAIALLVIGAGLWIRFANSNQRPVQQAVSPPQSVTPPKTTPAPKEQMATSLSPEESKAIPHGGRNPKQNLIALRRRPTQPPAPLTEEELAQKEQVLVALRLVSAKLNLAQRRAQGLPPVNAIRNHKIG
jgi:hypothetical protein